jgi:hypothetical protein
MAEEQGGITELQLLQQEIEVLKRVLAGSQNAKMASEGCARILGNIQKCAQDSFVVIPEQPGNPYHSSTSGSSSADGGCCAVQ